MRREGRTEMDASTIGWGIWDGILIFTVLFAIVGE
jgi:hypothetical protein